MTTCLLPSLRVVLGGPLIGPTEGVDHVVIWYIYICAMHILLYLLFPCHSLLLLDAAGDVLQLGFLYLHRKKEIDCICLVPKWCRRYTAASILCPRSYMKTGMCMQLIIGAACIFGVTDDAWLHVFKTQGVWNIVQFYWQLINLC